MGEFHSQTASVFHLGSAIESLQMQMLPERERDREREGKRERCGEDEHWQEGGHCSQDAVLVQCSDMAPPASGEPPVSTTLPTTEECEASSIWTQEEPVGVKSFKRFLFKKKQTLIERQTLFEIVFFKFHEEKIPSIHILC